MNDPLDLRLKGREGSLELEPSLRVERLRLQLYAIGLLISFLVYLLVNHGGRSDAFWLLSLAIVAGLTLNMRRPATVLRAAAMAAVAISLWTPLAPAVMASGMSFPDAVSQTVVWPQIFVALFASRALAEECALRFHELWRRPVSPHGSVQLQSTPAAFALGSFLLLSFYNFMPRMSASSSDPALEVIRSSVAGSTVIHVAILFLFFVAMAHIGEAGLLQLRERLVLRRLKRCIQTGSVRASVEGGESKFFFDAEAEGFPSQALGIVRAAAIADPRGEPLAAMSYEDFQTASRRFMRNLVVMLPMLGFLGTIVGLSTTLAELPNAIGVGADPQALDFSGALGGLAIKFQTTLLGLLASMICGAALSVLERKELELKAECMLLADVMRRRND